MVVGLTGEMHELIKPESKDDWEKIKGKYFVLDEKDPYDLRMPGKWKEEFSTNNGGICM